MDPVVPGPAFSALHLCVPSAALRLASYMSPPPSVPPLPLQQLPQDLHHGPTPNVPGVIPMHPWERCLQHPPPPALPDLWPLALWAPCPADQVLERVGSGPSTPSSSSRPLHVADELRHLLRPPPPDCSLLPSLSGLAWRTHRCRLTQKAAHEWGEIVSRPELCTWPGSGLDIPGNERTLSCRCPSIGG